jgi:hypothetical protein
MGRKSSRLVEGHRLCEHVTLGVLARVVPVGLVVAALRDTGRWNWRARQLLLCLVVYYVMAPQHPDPEHRYTPSATQNRLIAGRVPGQLSKIIF